MGIKANFLELQQYQNQLEPFRMDHYNITMNESINGTLFRVPLRSKEAAEKSLLANHFYSEENIREMLYEFCEVSTSMLLFVKYIQNIKVFIKSPNSFEMIHEVSISNLNDSLLNSKQFFNNYILSEPENSDQFDINDWKTTIKEDQYQLEFDISTQLPSTDLIVKNEKWFICSIISLSGVGGELLGQSVKHQWGNIAAPLNFSQIVEKGFDKEKKIGRLYCSLPLPIETNLPVHINGNFALTSNRRHLWSGKDMIGVGAFKVKWNNFLLEHLLPRAYDTLLTQLSTKFKYFQNENNVEDFYQLWPCLNENSEIDSFVKLLSIETLKYMRDQRSKVLWSRSLKEWVPIYQFTYVQYSMMPIELSIALKNIDLRVVELPSYMIDYLNQILKNYQCSPEFVIDYLQKKGKGKWGLPGKEADILLYYLLTDQSTRVINTFNEKRKFIKSLIGLKLIPLQNGNTATINDCNHQNVVYFCQNEAQAGLLAKVGTILDQSSKCYPIISSEQLFSTELNIRRLTPKVLPQFIAQILPSAWKGCTVIRFVESTMVNFRGSKGEGIHSLPKAQLESIIENIRNMWEFILLAPHVPRFDNFPTILVFSGDKYSVITVDTLASKGIFRDTDFAPNEVEFLSRFGVEFIHPYCARVLDSMKVPTSDIINYIARTKMTINEGEAPLLREVLKKSILMRGPDYKSNQIGHIRSLPIFRTLTGRFLPICNSVSAYKRAITFPLAWSHLSSQTLPLETLDTTDPINSFLLSYLEPEKYDDVQYIKDVIIYIINHLSSNDFVYIFQLLSKTSIHQDNRSRFFAQIIDAFIEKPIIVFPDGYRARAEDVIDQMEYPDFLVGGNNNDGHLYLPDIYLPYTKLLKVFGMKSISNFPIFLRFVQQIIQGNQIENAKQLINFLLSKEPKWSTANFSELHELEFVPAYDLTHCKTFSQVLEILDSPTHLKQFEKLTSFKNCCFRDDALYGFSKFYIFDSAGVKISNKVKTQLGFSSPVPLDHMIEFVKIYIKQNSQIIKHSSIEQMHYRQFLYRLFSAISAIKKSKSKLADIRDEIAHLPFILRDNNQLAAPQQFNEELTEDLGLYVFAIPEFLQPFAFLFSKLRDNVALKRAEPVVALFESPSPSSFGQSILDRAKEHDRFSDVTLHCNGRTFHGHKLILFHSTRFFEKAFTSGMKEASQGHLDIHIPEWVSIRAFELVYEFLYSRSLEHVQHLRKNQENADLVCDLLRCSDYLEVDHLKQWCEVYLAELNNDVFNYVELLLLSVDTNAHQLRYFSIYHINVNFSLISHTEQWNALPENLKNLVTSAFHGESLTH